MTDRTSASRAWMHLLFGLLAPAQAAWAAPAAALLLGCAAHAFPASAQAKPVKPNICVNHPSTANFPTGKLLGLGKTGQGELELSPHGDRAALISRVSGLVQIEFHDRTCRVPEIAHGLEFSADGRVDWFFHEQDGQRFITVNGDTRHVASHPGRNSMKLSTNGGWAYWDTRMEKQFEPHLLHGGRYGLNLNPGLFVPKEKSYLLHAGRTIGPHDYIGDIAFGPEGALFGYRIDNKTDTTYVVGGKKYPAKKYFFSTDYTRQASRERKGGKEYLVLDGVRHGGYDKILDARWTDRGDAWFRYQKDGLEYLHIAGQDHGGYDQSYPPELDGQGRPIIRYRRGGQWFQSHAGNTMGPSHDVPSIVFSPDKARHATVLSQNGRSIIHMGGKQWTCDHLSDLVVNNEGHVACLCRQGETLFLRRDEELLLIGHQDAVWSYGFPALSADHAHHGYLAWENRRDGSERRAYAFVDGKRFGPFPHVRDLRFSPDGKHFAFATEGGLNLDGRGTQRDTRLWGFAATVDWSTVAYRMEATRGRRRETLLRVNGQEYPGDDGWSPLLSPDRRHIAYSHRTEGGWQVVYDNRPIGVFAWARVVFAADGSPVLLTVKNNAVWREAIE